MIITLPKPDDTKVISIEVVRMNRQHRRMMAACAHQRTIVDTSLNQLECKDCGKMLNPIEWVASLAEEWAWMQHRVKEYRDAIAKYEKRSRTTCQHCGKMTNISHK